MIMLAIVIIGIGLTTVASLCEFAPVWDDDKQAPADVSAPAAEHA